MTTAVNVVVVTVAVVVVATAAGRHCVQCFSCVFIKRKQKTHAVDGICEIEGISLRGDDVIRVVGGENDNICRLAAIGFRDERRKSNEKKGKMKRNGKKKRRRNYHNYRMSVTRRLNKKKRKKRVAAGRTIWGGAVYLNFNQNIRFNRYSRRRK